MNNKEDYLNLIPVKNIEFEIVNDLVVLVVPKNPKKYEKLFFKKWSSEPNKYDLDEIGSYIWLCCDGINTFESILDKSREKFEDKIEPAFERIKLFLDTMSKNQFIKYYKKISN